MTAPVRKWAEAEGRAAVLRAARRLFSEQGYRGVSIEDIARSAGVSKGLVLYHFQTKEKLFGHLIGEAKDELFCRLDEALQGQPTARDKLTALLAVYLRLVKSHRKLWRIVLQEAHSLKGPVRELLVGCRQASLRRIASILEEGVARGEFRDLDRQLASLCLLGIISERVLGSSVPAQEAEVEELARRITELFLYGFAGPPAPVLASIG